MTIHQVYVPNLRVEGQLQYESRKGARSLWSPLHLQQSPLDGACGIHALLIAVALTTRVPRSQLEKVSEATRGPWHAFFLRSRKFYFAGASPRDLQGCAAELDGVQAKRHRIDSAQQAYEVCLDVIEAGGVPIIGLDGPTLSHWSVAIGCETRDGLPSALLCLDPSKNAPQASFANAWLDLRRVHRSGKGRKLYDYRDIDGGLRWARVSSVLVVTAHDDIAKQAR